MKKSNNINIAMIVSRFNHEITEKLYAGAIERLQELNFDMSRIPVLWVPGAIEIPITAKRLAETSKYDVIICLGAVILGETKHFDYVCQQVSHGCQMVALTHNIPVIFGVLTTETDEQAFARAGGEKGHIGRSSVDSAIELMASLDQI